MPSAPRSPHTVARSSLQLAILSALVLRASAQSSTEASVTDDMRAVRATGIQPHTVHAPETRDRTTPTPPRLTSGAFVTFFPPAPPVYGSAISDPPSTSIFRLNGRELIASDELADFVGETFYPALATRLHEKSVGKKLEARVNAYRAQRDALCEELMDELRRTQSLPKPAREQALQAFAPRQAAPLAALEAEAEQLRRALIEGGFFSRKLDWNAARSWRLNEGTVAAPPQKPEAEFQVARVAAFFQDALSIEQRGLLRELAFDLARTARAARGSPALRDDDPRAVFFSPETARLRLPPPLPPELFARLGRFNTEKAALKAELLETLVAADDLPESDRTARFATLASVQQRRIAALEQSAEEVRRSLDALTDAPLPWLPPLPPPLRERIEAYNRDRHALIAAFSDHQALAIRHARHFHTAPALSRSPEERSRDTAPSLSDAARAAAREFEDLHAAEITALRARYERIRSDLADVARDLVDPRTQRALTIETLLEGYRVAMQRFDQIGREEVMYERYRLATLQPGLSPAQRRLLFRSAHACLAQALPRGQATLAHFPTPRPES